MRGAIRTDLILSAEIMAITLASVADEPVLDPGLRAGRVGIGITAVVYGVVAVIVKADDVGVALAESPAAAARAVGRAIVRAMPPFLKVPVAARHRRHALGRRRHRPARAGAVWLAAPADAIHDVAHLAGEALAAIGPVADLAGLGRRLGRVRPRRSAR